MALENVYYGCHLFSPISSKWSQWLLCSSLEKLKDMNIFLAPSIEEAQTKMTGLLRAASTLWWRVSVIHRGLENNDVSKGTKQVHFNEMPLSRQYILLYSSVRLLVQVCRGSQQNLNSCLTVTAMLITNKARTKTDTEDRKRNIKREVALLLWPLKHQDHQNSFARQLNWDIRYCCFPLLWRADDPCCGLVGQHLRKGPQETKVGVVCVRVCVRACVSVNHSGRPPIITLSERAVGRIWRRGPQLSQGLVGGPQWLIASPHKHILEQTHPKASTWPCLTPCEHWRRSILKIQAQKQTQRSSKPSLLHTKSNAGSVAKTEPQHKV